MNDREKFKAMVMVTDPVFPQETDWGEDGQGIAYSSGLTKLELFAAMAMQSLIKTSYLHTLEDQGRRFAVTKLAVMYAEALAADLSKDESCLS